MVRNGDKYYFPIKESIESILPIVDEFIVAIGKGDPDDKTLERIESIQSPKIKIYHREWDEKKFIDGLIFKDETDFALSKCSGDWCFYLQADEIIHEDDLDPIYQACESGLEDDRLDGLLFNYLHFWGDYDHYLPLHGWYKNEIRLIKNHREIMSYKDAQSFRKKNNVKLNVKLIDAKVYHYGWVRPPRLLQLKKKEQDGMHIGKEKAKQEYKKKQLEFDYGPLGRIPVYIGKHPKVMRDWMEKLDWKQELNYSRQDNNPGRKKHKHEKLKNRVLSWIENNWLGGKDLFGYSNWILRK